MKQVEGWYCSETMQHGLGVYHRRSAVIDVALTYLPTDRRHGVIQAGGHMGVWPYRLSSHFAWVHTWEPEPVNLKCLAKNLQDIKNVTITAGCLGDEAGPTLLEDKSNKNSGAHFINPKGTISSHIYRIDDYDFPTSIDAMFLDLEGYEMHALLGGHVLIHNHRPGVLVIEENTCGTRRFGIAEDAIRNYLKQFGYVVAERWEEDVIYVLEDYHHDR